MSAIKVVNVLSELLVEKEILKKTVTYHCARHARASLKLRFRVRVI